MSLLDAYGRRLSRGEVPSPASPEADFAVLGGAYNFAALFHADSAARFRVAAAFCAGRVIAEGVSQIPLKVMRSSDSDLGTMRKVASDDPRHHLLHRRPNEWQTSSEWREMMTLHAVFTGTGRSLIARDTKGVSELLPLMPQWMTVRPDPDNPWGRIYDLTVPGTRSVTIPASDVFEIRGPGWDILSALDVTKLAANALGLAAGLEDTAIDTASRRGMVHGVISADNGLAPETKEALKTAWADKFGPGKPGGVAVLDFAAKFAQIQMNAKDQQSIEQREFAIQEAARYYRVHPTMLMQTTSNTSYGSVSEFFVQHVVHTLDPWIERWTQALDAALFDGSNDLYAHFVVAGLLRGSPMERAEIYKAALGSGGHAPWMTPNEVRALEDLNPVPGGDRLYPPAHIAKQETTDDVA